MISTTVRWCSCAIKKILLKLAFGFSSVAVAKVEKSGGMCNPAAAHDGPVYGLFKRRLNDRQGQIQVSEAVACVAKQ